MTPRRASIRTPPSEIGREQRPEVKDLSILSTEEARHTTNPPDSCLSRFLHEGRRRGCDEGSTAPPGGRFWHGFAVRRPPVGRGGRGLTFGLLDAWELRPMQSPPALDIGGMKRKSSGSSFFTERTLADFLAVSDRTIRNWIRRGELPSYKLGAARRIDPADVETFLARHRDESS
jgi:excisionase family DNA binding protein